MSSSTKICENIFEAIREIDPDNIILQYRGKQGGFICKQNFTCLGMENGTVGAFTLSPFPQYYRGECNLHDHCYSSLDRIENKEDKMIGQLKTQDFISLLKRNPDIQSAVKRKEYTEFNAMAQHYGFPTRMLDVTNDLLIAAYFAIHEINSITGAFDIKKSGIGRIRWSDELPKPEGRLSFIGMQALARPGVQSAFGIYLEEGEDYATESSSVEFRQDAVANQEFFQMILEGPQKIYPIENVNILADRIKTSPCVTAEAVSIFCQKYGRRREDVIGVLRRKNIYVVDAPVADWCLIQGRTSIAPPITRNQVLRPAFII